MQVALVGAPNVGKSFLVNVLSSGVPEVCDYPFTTRSIKMGHFYVNGQRHQVQSPPWLLLHAAALPAAAVPATAAVPAAAAACVYSAMIAHNILLSRSVLGGSVLSGSVLSGSQRQKPAVRCMCMII